MKVDAMRNVRLIARLDVKGESVVKGVHLEGLRVIGDPHEYARRYYTQGADELVYMDIVASLYGRSKLAKIVQRAAKDVFIPLTVGGGARNIDDVRDLLRAGADKVAINTAAVCRPELIREVATRFGSQCLVLSIEAKKHQAGQWEACTDGGRERSGLDAVEWAQRGAMLGAGEILVTSIDREGTRNGFDLELISMISDHCDVPVIASGGMGEAQHAIEAVRSGGVDAVAMADILHYGRATVSDVRQDCAAAGLNVRKCGLG